MSEKVRKWSTYLTPNTIRAVKRLSADKGIPVCKIVELALKKVISAKYFEEQA